MPESACPPPQVALDMQSSGRAESDAYSRTLEARLAAQESENAAQRALSSALNARINAMEQQLSSQSCDDHSLAALLAGALRRLDRPHPAA
jgi:hypothetical protein